MPTPKKPARSRGGTAGGLPDLIYAQASPHSVGGTSLFDAGAGVHADNVRSFFSEGDVVQAASARLQEAGFQVLQVSPTSINIAGPPSAYESAFGAELVTVEREVLHGGQELRSTTFIDDASTDVRGYVETRDTALGDVLEGVAIEEPVVYFQNAFPPSVPYWHLDVPADVSLGLNADRAHRAGITGRGVHVCMVDTGWFKHPYFVQRGYRSAPVVLAPGATAPADDPVGHGTGESANAFAAAPDIEFTMVKQSPTNTTASFNTAVGLAPQIISCSWGYSIPNGPLPAALQVLAAAIATAVASGIIVVFSAGNGHWGFPGQHPDVISAGGTVMAPDGSLAATDYASGFASNIYRGRRVPDVTGLVGTLPHAMYIMLPLQAGDQIDSGNAGGTFPNGDETGAKDGWAAFSGTSAAAPQIAGVCALMKQACPRLTPAGAKRILMSTARDVTTGTAAANTGGHAATVGPDLATGAGLVDAHKAALLAKVRCLRPPIGGIKLPPEGRPPIKLPKPPNVFPPTKLPTGPDPRPIETPVLSEEDVTALEALILDGSDVGDLL